MRGADSAHPSSLASVVPLSLPCHSFFRDVVAESMLLSCLPSSNVLAAISPHEGAFSLSFIVDKVTCMALSVFPFERAFTVHLVLLPLACISLAVRPVVVADTTDFIDLELPFIVAAISKSQSALSLLFTVYIFALVARAVRPRFNSMSVLLIV